MSMTLTLIAISFPAWEAALTITGATQAKGLWLDCFSDNMTVIMSNKTECVMNEDSYAEVSLAMAGTSILLQWSAIIWSIFSFCVCCCPALFGPIGALKFVACCLNISTVYYWYSQTRDEFFEYLDEANAHGADTSFFTTYFNPAAFCLYIMFASAFILLVVTILAQFIQYLLSKAKVG
ncbi:unnamed protein product [Bursaphelenchus okinawaensis]|uniref:Uncharacterized protein n=1 Tax=Bursaphelenchus okinawaensis TaxID=465554 RepID=A0A811JRN6_9BILA|nr:unnamed protein product [Bursaphelenchus okinawaensis]CAG9079875.1 unnamed protein product [Bursaphelenchus okinawaensis]